MHAPSNSLSSKSVSFARSAKMRLGIHLTEYDTKELTASFYSRNDYTRFKEDARITARLVEDGQITSGMSDFCERGVERFTKDGATLVIVNRKRARHAVLTEQRNLRLEAASDMVETDSSTDSRLAAAYKSAIAACDSVSIAYLRGLSDEKIARLQQRFSPKSYNYSTLGSPVQLTESGTTRNLLVRRVLGTASAA